MNASNPPTVLVVEDNAVIALDIALSLKDEGFRVLGPVARVEPALRILAASEVHVALLDVDLGTELSFPVAKLLQEMGIPFAFVTGKPTGDIDQFFPVTVVVQKPVVGEILLEVVRMLLNRAS